MRVKSPKQVRPKAKLQKLRSFIQKRYSLACQAFSRHLEWAKSEEYEPDYSPCQQSLGLLEEVESDSPEILRLGPGEVTYDSYQLKLSPERLSLLAEDKITHHYHGEYFNIGHKKFRLSMLSATSIGKSFLQLVIVASCLFSSLSAKNIDVESGQDIEFQFDLPGLTSVSDDNIKIRVFADNETFETNEVEVNKAPETTHIVVDVSGLCIQRGMERELNQQIAELVGLLHVDSTVSIAEYYKDASGTDIYQKNIDSQTAGQLRKRKSFVVCRESTRAMNALLAVEKIAKLEKVDSLLVISSGNIRESQSAKQMINKLKLKFSASIYAPRVTEYASKILKPLTEEADGAFFKMGTDDGSRLIEQYPFKWSVRIKSFLPLDAEPKLYPFEFSLGEKHLLSGTVNFKKNKTNILIHWAIWIAAALLVLAAVAYLIYQIYLYYRTPVCPKTEQRMSRSWSGSLHDDELNRPCLFVYHNDIYHSAHVLEESSLSIGRGFRDKLRLKTKRQLGRIIISEVAENCFEVYSADDKAFYLNEQKVQQARLLKLGDKIEYGPYSIHFLKAEKNSQEAA